MVCENPSVPTVSEKGATQCPHFIRSPYPTRSFRIEVTEQLQTPVLVLRQEFDSHGLRHVDGAILRLVLFSRIQRLAVVTKAPAAFRAFVRAVEKDVLPRFSVMFDDVRLATRPLHFREREQFFRFGVQSRAHVGPDDSLVTVRVLFETGFQNSEEFFELFSG